MHFVGLDVSYGSQHTLSNYNRYKFLESHLYYNNTRLVNQSPESHSSFDNCFT